MDKPTILAWPRLLSLDLAAQYCSVSTRTLQDWIADGLILPVPMPGSILRSKHRRIICRSGQRNINKTLIDIVDLDALIETRKEAL